MTRTETIEQEIKNKTESGNQALKWTIQEIKERLDNLTKHYQGERIGLASVELECLVESLIKESVKLKELYGTIRALKKVKEILESKELE